MPLSTWKDEPRKCDLCGQEKPGFAGRYRGRADFDHVCESCLRSGRLEDHGARTCDGDLHRLREQLVHSHPGLSSAALDEMVAARTAELEHATPDLVAWQDWLWPAHCGDYCVFVEELGQPEIEELATPLSPEEWLSRHEVDGQPPPWDCIRSRSARAHPAESYDLTVYRFVCIECGHDVVVWDAS